MGIRGAVVVASIVALSAAAQVHAEPRNATSTARELSEQARRVYNLGNWQEAIDAFARAYQITGDPALLFNLGQAHRQAGHTADALRFYRIYLREDPAGSNSAIARQQINQLEAQPQPVPTESTAKVPTPPVSNAPVGVPNSSPVNGEPAPHSPDPGDSSVRHSASEPGAAKPLALSEAPVLKADVIAHLSNETRSERSSRPLPAWLPWTAAAVSVALLTTAVILHVEANNRFNDLQTSCAKTPTGCTSSEVDGVKSRDHATTGLLIAGGVAAVGSGLAFFANGTF